MISLNHGKTGVLHRRVHPSPAGIKRGKNEGVLYNGDVW